MGSLWAYIDWKLFVDLMLFCLICIGYLSSGLIVHVFPLKLPFVTIRTWVGCLGCWGCVDHVDLFC